MTKRARMVSAVLLVGVLGMTAWELLRAREPVYESKRISQWIRHPVYRGSNHAIVPEAMLCDSNAIPFLVDALRQQDGWLGRAYHRTWNSLPPWLQERSRLPLPTPAYALRSNAAQILGGMGTSANPAIPALIETLIKDGHSEVRRVAAFSLGEVGKGDKAVVSALTGALNDGAPMVRQAAALNLRRVDPVAAAKAGVNTNAPGL